MSYLGNLNFSNSIKDMVRGTDAKIKIVFKDEDNKEVDLKKYIVTYDIIDLDGIIKYNGLSFNEKFQNGFKFFIMPYTITEKLNGQYNLKIYIESLDERKAFNNFIEVR